MRTDSLAHRVARRHLRRADVAFRDVPPTSVEVIYSDGGIISARDVERLLKPRLGVLMQLRFRPSLVGTPNTVAWEGVSDRAEVVTGTLVLHAGVREDQVVSWAEIMMGGENEDDHQEHFASASVGDPQLRLRQVGRMARGLINRIRRDNTTDWKDVVAGLISVVEVAESEDDLGRESSEQL
jgi:hypothetical protein